MGRVGPSAGAGGIALFARVPFGSLVVADEDTLTLELDGDAVSDVLEDHFPILHHVLREMSRRSIDLLTRFRPDPGAGVPECPLDDPGTGGSTSWTGSSSSAAIRRGWLRARGSSGVAVRPGPGFPLGALEALGEVPRWYEAVAETPVVALQGHSFREPPRACGRARG